MPTPLTQNSSLQVFGENVVDKVKYNGFTFPLGRKSDAAFTPVYDDTNRAIKYIQVDLTVDFYLWPGLGDDTPTYTQGTGVDSTFESMRRKLSQPGQRLQFSSQGAGTFDIQNTVDDVDFGPKPEIVQWKPVGGRAACHVVWKCSARIVDCDFSTFNNDRILQVPFSVTWSIPPNGTTTRIISGKIEIAQSRRYTPASTVGTTQAQLAISRTADEWREQIIERFPALPQFHRTQNFSLSPDRKHLNFAIIDSEINSPEPYGLGIANKQITYNASSSLLGSSTGIGGADGFHKWLVTLSGNIEVAAGFSKVRAWTCIIDLMNERFINRQDKGKAKRLENSNNPDASPTDTNEVRSHAILLSINIGEELYGRNVNFSFTWMLTTTLAKFFEATGMFQPLNLSGYDWQLWRTSMNRVQGARGHKTMGFVPQDDIIVDVCAGGAIAAGNPTAQLNDEETARYKAGKDDTILAEDSWVTYKSSLTLETKHGVSYGIEMTEIPPMEEVVTDIPEEFEPTPNTKPIEDPSAEADTTLKTPQASSTSDAIYKVTMTGSAIRVGYGITPPNLVKYGGRKAIKTGTDYVEPRVVGIGSDLATGREYTIYACRWRKSYLLDGKPGNNTTDSSHDPRIYS